MKYVLGGLVGLLGVGLIAFVIYISFFPSGRALINSYDNMMQKVDDATTYETRKQVEDTARASIASYKTDRASENKEKQSWAEQAKMRANKTANIFNEYMRKNSYVFEGNIPSDIDFELEILE